MTILITGGAGFIGSNFALDWLAESDETIVNLDKLTYAGNLQNLASVAGDARHVFTRSSLSDTAPVKGVFRIPQWENEVSSANIPHDRCTFPTFPGEEHSRQIGRAHV